MPTYPAAQKSRKNLNFISRLLAIAVCCCKPADRLTYLRGRSAKPTLNLLRVLSVEGVTKFAQWMAHNHPNALFIGVLDALCEISPLHMKGMGEVSLSTEDRIRHQLPMGADRSSFNQGLRLSRLLRFRLASLKESYCENANWWADGSGTDRSYDYLQRYSQPDGRVQGVMQ